MNIIHHELGRDKLYKIWNTTANAMIIYTYSDGGSIVFEDRILPIQKGALCYIAPGVRHYTMPSLPTEYDRSKIFLTSECLVRLVEAMPKSSELKGLFDYNSVVYASVPDDLLCEVEAVYKKAYEASIFGECFEETVISSFLDLMIFLKRFTAQHIHTPQDGLSQSIEYINTNYKNRITLDDICEYIHLSKYHFCRKFKEMFGMTVMDYIKETRIANAKSLLLHSDLTVDAIGETCGFSGLSYFSQIFKSAVGMSPSQYRKNGIP